MYPECVDASVGIWSVGAAQGSAAAVGSFTSKASGMLRAGESRGGQIMNMLSRNTAWRNIGRFGRSGAVDMAGRFILGAGAALTAVGVYQETHNIGQSAVDAVGDTAIGWGATEVGAEAGGEIGLAVGGPVGGLVGAGVGALAGAAVSYVASGGFNRLVSDVASWF